MKPINIESLVDAYKNLSNDVFQKYIKNYGFTLKEQEAECLSSLIEKFEENSSSSYSYQEFFLSFTINQISKEFDLLRFGENQIINIELKSNSTLEKVKDQLIKNKYYLKFLGKIIHLFSYISSEKKLYFLNDENDLQECDFNVLIEKLEEQTLIEVADLNKLFDVSNYLVSPFNSTDKFLEGEYFLTDQQIQIKKDFDKNTNSFFCITGGPGTGKTLLTYDIAKTFKNKMKKVLIIHCGSLNNGHHHLRENEWNISSIKYYDRYNLEEFDLIILDEVHRIYKYQLVAITSSIKKNSIKCIFSYDPNQWLHCREKNNNIDEYIKTNLSPKKHHLKGKIRSNKEIKAFIKNLFDLSKINDKENYSNIEIKYFSEISKVKKHINYLKYKGWTPINYTPSQYTNNPYDQYNDHNSNSAHRVIGQEFDKVVVILDSNFYYNSKGKLSYRVGESQTYYNATQMLFQMVTRTRKKLYFIILDNEIMLEECLKILKRNIEGT